MPVRLPPVTEHASRILLEGIVDFAALFPPAAAAMPTAVRNYAHYRAGGSGWMLGRFVCSASTLEQFSAQADPLLPRDAGAIPWRLSATASGDVAADIDAIAAFNERHRVCFDECGAFVDSYEVKVATPDDVSRIDGAAPRDLLLYLEVAPADATRLVPEIAARGRRAKLRTGGLTAEAFPRAEDIATFLQTCIEYAVPAKATAGLHHPLHGRYRLTYEDAAPMGEMFGYLNVLMAAALLAQGEDARIAVHALGESDPRTLTIDEFHLHWHSSAHEVALERALLQQVRERVLVSFGSCSFTEPVDEIRAMGWI
jgi:hypothetical protein